MYILFCTYFSFISLLNLFFSLFNTIFLNTKTPFPMNQFKYFYFLYLYFLNFSSAFSILDSVTIHTYIIIEYHWFFNIPTYINYYKKIDFIIIMNLLCCVHPTGIVYKVGVAATLFLSEKQLLYPSRLLQVIASGPINKIFYKIIFYLLIKTSS